MHQHKCVLAYLNTNSLQPSLLPSVWPKRPGYSAFTPTQRGRMKGHGAAVTEAQQLFSIYPVITEDETTVGPNCRAVSGLSKVISQQIHAWDGHRTPLKLYDKLNTHQVSWDNPSQTKHPNQKSLIRNANLLSNMVFSFVLPVGWTIK